MTAAKNPEVLAESTVLKDPENIIIPPCDLYSDEPPLESDLHREQIELLLACLKWLWQERNDYYATGNLTIYYSEEHITTRDFRGPDFFVVLGTQNYPRRSWMLWAEEGKYPNVIVELLSNSTQKVDKTTKKELYQNTFRTPEYFWFHPETLEFQGFRLMSSKYQPIEPTDEGWLWSEQLELFLGINDRKLRYFTQDKQLVVTPEERAKIAQQQLEEERKQKESAQQRVEELLAKLKDLGVDE
ncbi:MAG: Uma2 family endonuclease [Cyanobacteria bacterium J06636_27]